MSSSSTSCDRRAGKRPIRSSSSSRTVSPSAATWRSPPTCSRSVGGMRTVVMPAPPSCGLPRPGAELDVVDVLRDRRVVAADGAVRVAADRDLAELRGERVEEEETPYERLADAERELQRL